MRKAYINIVFTFISLLFVQLAWAQEAEEKLFQLKSADQTGITFSNQIQDTKEANLSNVWEFL